MQSNVADTRPDLDNVEIDSRHDVARIMEAIIKKPLHHTFGAHTTTLQNVSLIIYNVVDLTDFKNGKYITTDLGRTTVTHKELHKAREQLKLCASGLHRWPILPI